MSGWAVSFFAFAVCLGDASDGPTEKGDAFVVRGFSPSSGTPRAEAPDYERTPGAEAPDYKRGRPSREQYTLADNRLEWPSWANVVRVVSMRDYNTRVVLLGTMLLGLTAGVVGSFMLLRKRSLMGDVVSHAALPGICLAFLVMVLTGSGSGKSLPGLLTGAFLAGILGILVTTAIRRSSRIKEDAALAIVLSVFFGLGVVLLSIIQDIPAGSAAGLSQFIFGKAASMIAADVVLIAQGAAIVLAICLLLFKEFGLLCFDAEFAAAQGWPVLRLDLMLLGLVVGVTIIGLQSVGLLLVVAMLIVPAAAARFWTDNLGRMTLAAGVIGGLSAYIGVLFSALFPRLAAGAVIVLVSGVCFLFSMLFGGRRGVLRRVVRHRRMRARVGRLDLLRAIYEVLEATLAERLEPRGSPSRLTQTTVPFAELLAERSWTPGRLRSLISVARRDELLAETPPDRLRLTAAGAVEAERIVRNHRLWELYLIHHADIAPSHVDRDADLIEHVLEPELVAELEALLSQEQPPMTVPPSPHAIERRVAV